MAKVGFNGQWIEIFHAGLQTDNKGKQHRIDKKFLEQVVSNYDESLHESPAVIGHPETNNPAFGWTKKLRVNGDKLEAQFADTNDDFEAMVRNGSFKKRSASFYLDSPSAPGGKAPYLRHVGFLGAQPPAVKGLRDIQFGEGESLTFEIQFNEGETMEEKDMDKVADSIWERFKAKLGLTESNPQSQPAKANFSEADVQSMLDKAVNSVKAEFNEKLTAAENQNKKLAEQVNSLSGSSQRAEIIAFTEKLGVEKFPPAFNHMGAIDFMEAIAANETKVSIVSFSEEGGKKVETKTESTPLDWFKNFLSSMPPFIAFGEHFANITGTSDTNNAVDPQRIETMRKEMGIKKNGGEK